MIFFGHCINPKALWQHDFSKDRVSEVTTYHTNSIGKLTQNKRYILFLDMVMLFGRIVKHLLSNIFVCKNKNIKILIFQSYGSAYFKYPLVRH